MNSAPGHVANVRQHVIDALTPEQLHQLGDMAEAVLNRLDPNAAMSANYHRYDTRQSQTGNGQDVD
jgi:hypothetical protein